MKLPSIQQVAADSSRTLRRFPLILIDAAIGTVSAVVLIEQDAPVQPSVFFNILLAAILGIPFLIGIAVAAEKRKWGFSATVAAQLIALFALAAYAWSVPSDLNGAPSVHFFRFLMIGAALHLFVAVAPYAGTGETNGFWHYNKTLLLRSCTAALYSVVLNGGLAIALAALDNLFGIDVPPRRYGELWIVINGIFTTWFFLGGIPEKLDELEACDEYPKGIKIFAQYILLPLVLVYLVILYAYLGKIVISWDWPKGWVSGLILGFSTVGILMHLLFYPIRERAENIWIKSASRWLYVVMIPLILMLLLAVWRRVSEYGVTEGRYVGLATGLWLAAVVLYFIVSKGKSIKFIPASLGIVSLVICFGPWGAFHISESSQVERLEELLKRTSILRDGKIRPAEASVPIEETKQISSIVGYLHDIHGYDRIQSWFGESLRIDSTEGKLASKDPAIVAKMMGIEYVRIWGGTGTNEVNLRADMEPGINVAGYDRLWREQFVTSDGIRKKLPGGDLGYDVSKSLDTLTLLAMKEGKATDSIQVEMKPFVEKLLAEYKNANAANIPPERMSITIAEGRIKAKLYVSHVYGRRLDGVLKLASYELTILFSLATDAAP